MNTRSSPSVPREWTQDEIDAEMIDEMEEQEWWDEMMCSRDRHGYCGQAGSEYCEFECPFRKERLP